LAGAFFGVAGVAGAFFVMVLVTGEVAAPLAPSPFFCTYPSPIFALTAGQGVR